MTLQFKFINGQSCWLLATRHTSVIISRSEAEHVYRSKLQQVARKPAEAVCLSK